MDLRTPRPLPERKKQQRRKACIRVPLVFGEFQIGLLSGLQFGKAGLLGDSLDFAKNSVLNRSEYNF